MISYTSINGIEDGDIVMCKVELHTIEESKTIEFGKKTTKKMCLELRNIPMELGEIQEGDILIVEHDTEQITSVLYKDDEEKQRRIDYLTKLLEE